MKGDWLVQNTPTKPWSPYHESQCMFIMWTPRPKGDLFIHKGPSEIMKGLKISLMFHLWSSCLINLWTILRRILSKNYRHFYKSPGLLFLFETYNVCECVCACIICIHVDICIYPYVYLCVAKCYASSQSAFCTHTHTQSSKIFLVWDAAFSTLT